MWYVIAVCRRRRDTSLSCVVDDGVRRCRCVLSLYVVVVCRRQRGMSSSLCVVVVDVAHCRCRASSLMNSVVLAALVQH